MSESYGGNTMKIDADSIEKINNNYKGIIQNWKAESSEDENVYETSDLKVHRLVKPFLLVL